MRLPFRHGIASSQTVPFLFYNSSGNVDLLANNRPFTINVAHKTTNYLHSEDNTVSSAWEGPFLPADDYWLYIEFDTRTFERTFGWVTEAMQAQATAPTNPTDQTTWFDTTKSEQYVWQGQTWSTVIRMFIAKMNNRQFYSVSQDSPKFTGSQIGNSQSIKSGRILYTEYGNPLTKDNKTFITTEDQFFTNQSQAIGVRLESNITTAKASESLAQYQIVAVDINGNIRPAQYADVSDRIIAVVTEDLQIGETGNIVVQGTIINPAWDFSALQAGTKLYVQNGELLRTDPHISNPATNPKPQVPVAKVLSGNSIIFEQGLGGVGPIGPTGSIENLPAATQTRLGGVSLSVPPTTSDIPVAVGTNDPRLAGAPFAAGNHVHPASDISLTTAGNISAPTVQLAIQELDAEKLPISGGTVDGNVGVNGTTTLGDSLTINSGGLVVNGNATFNNLLTLSTDPVAPYEAATKRYVDNLTSGLKWLNPVCLANLIGDDISDPSGLTPVNGDAYILSAAGTGDWAGFAQNDVVRWNDPDATWVNGGQLDVTNFTELRFLIAGTSTTPATGSFVGREREIAEFATPSDAPTYEVPVNANAVYVCNAFSTAAYNQYVYDSDVDIWRQSGGSQTGIATDGLTIRQVGSTISTIPHADGGTVDASTYRGADLDTMYSQINHNHDTQYSPLGHGHEANSITINPLPINPTNAVFGTPTVATSNQTVSNNVRGAISELLEKKANNKPVYSAVTDLPSPAASRGMLAHVLSDNSIRFSMDNSGTIQWVPIAVNDGKVQDHEHIINYDLTFYAAGPAASESNKILARIIVPREISIPANSNLFARVINPPTSDVTFPIYINGTLSTISATLSPALSGGLFVDGNTGNDSFVLNAGDYIDLVSPSNIDNDVTDLALTIIGIANIGTI